MVYMREIDQHIMISSLNWQWLIQNKIDHEISVSHVTIPCMIAIAFRYVYEGKVPWKFHIVNIYIYIIIIIINITQSKAQSFFNVIIQHISKVKIKLWSDKLCLRAFYFKHVFKVFVMQESLGIISLQHCQKSNQTIKQSFFLFNFCILVQTLTLKLWWTTHQCSLHCLSMQINQLKSYKIIKKKTSTLSQK